MDKQFPYLSVRLIAAPLAIWLFASSGCAPSVLAQVQRAQTSGGRDLQQEVRTRWVRAGLNTNQPVWGMRGHLLFAIHPGGFSGGAGGPRGLIRLGYPTLPNGEYDLINFIAVEPVAGGRKGYSELEHSTLDNRPGKRFWVARESSPNPSQGLDCGRLDSIDGIEQLELTLFVERFENGAHVLVRLVQRSDAPDELRLSVEPEPDCAPIEYCILTATMGNKARARMLWLKGSPVSSTDSYPDYTGSGFAPHQRFALDRLPRNSGGDVVAAITTNEEQPSAVRPFGQPHFWDYRGTKVTQYWRMPADFVRDDLHCAVNGRFTYWGSQQQIPGGISFENFELRQKFRPGDQFVFGITPRPPSGLVTNQPQR